MEEIKNQIWGLRTTANREDQVMDFVSSKITKETNINVFSIIKIVSNAST